MSALFEKLSIVRKKDSLCEFKKIHQKDLSFGKVMTDHMFQMTYSNNEWHSPIIKPYESMIIDPSTSVLHYGQAVFEGIKAFYTAQGKINIFRLSDHIERLNRSCARICLPPFPEKELIDFIKRYISIESRWVSQKEYTSLYIRPLIFATDPYLGLRPSETYSCIVIASPAPFYYKNPWEKPLKLFCFGSQYVRSVVGGTGEAKTSGNYAGSLLSSHLARKEGYDQVLWLDGRTNTYIDEAGTMNIFFLIDGVLVTPLLQGAILDGITRRSIIALAKDMGIVVQEKNLSINTIVEGIESGAVQECFGTGTAITIVPINEIKYKDKVFRLNSKKKTESFLSKQLYKKILSHYHDSSEDIYNWNHLIEHS